MSGSAGLQTGCCVGLQARTLNSELWKGNVRPAINSSAGLETATTAGLETSATQINFARMETHLAILAIDSKPCLLLLELRSVTNHVQRPFHNAESSFEQILQL